MSTQTANGLPLTLKAGFQEYDFEQLDPAQHGDLIIERTLAYGNRAEVRWLLQTYGRSRVVTWLQVSGPQRLSKRRCNLWWVIFKLPLDQQPRPRRSGIWPY